MSQPAARLGDPTAHGGAVTSGNPTVLIGGQPAATVGDLHVCPLCSPGPHVGGPVSVGAPTVLIGGRPAARVGDACVCAAPAPDVIVAGCPTVLIGGASGAASPGAAAAVASAHGASLEPGTPGTGTTARPLSPWVGVGYVDAAGRPVTGWRYRAEGGADGDRQRDGQLGTGGQVWCDALAGSGPVKVGLVGVYGCRWARDEARVGEAVGMSARCVGVADGELALFEVWRETATATGAASRAKVWEVMGEVAGERVEAAAPFVFAWADGDRPAQAGGSATAEMGDEPATPVLPDLDGGGGRGRLDAMGNDITFSLEVSVGGVHRTRGNTLRVRDWTEMTFVDSDGEPVPHATFEILLGDGERRTGQADSAGRHRIDDVPPGNVVVLSVSTLRPT